MSLAPAAGLPHVNVSSGVDVGAASDGEGYVSISPSPGGEVSLVSTGTAKVIVDASSGSTSSCADVAAYAVAQASGHAASGASVTFSGNPAHQDASRPRGGPVPFAS